MQCLPSAGIVRTVTCGAVDDVLLVWLFGLDCVLVELSIAVVVLIPLGGVDVI